MRVPSDARVENVHILAVFNLMQQIVKSTIWRVCLLFSTRASRSMSLKVVVVLVVVLVVVVTYSKYSYFTYIYGRWRI